MASPSLRRVSVGSLAISSLNSSGVTPNNSPALALAISEPLVVPMSWFRAALNEPAASSELENTEARDPPQPATS